MAIYWLELKLRRNKNPTEVGYIQSIYYLFITYIVTSNPKRISVTAGDVHMIVAFNLYQAKLLVCNNAPIIRCNI
jgi:hypothetical protein